MWHRMMAVAFFANGLGAFGVRVLQGMGLAETHSFLYLSFWYLSGLAFALIAFLSRRSRLTGGEIIVGSMMGLFSGIGWILLTQAIARGVPGYLAFPVAIGGSLSIVAAAGVLVFREQLSPYGYLGILTGIAGVGMLASV